MSTGGELVPHTNFLFWYWISFWTIPFWVCMLDGKV